MQGKRPSGKRREVGRASTLSGLPVRGCQFAQSDMGKDLTRRNDRGANSKARLLAGNMVSKTWRGRRAIEPGRCASTPTGSASHLHEIRRVALREQNAENRR